MCRFICYTGQPTLMHQLIFNTEHSLIVQSKYSQRRSEPVNGDGFGIGWYPDFDDPVPGLFKSIEPAWNNRNLFYLTSKVKSSCFFAHIRDASPNLPVSQTNCHPFRYGRLLWMHNGWLEDFFQMKRLLVEHLSEKAFLGVQGNTDSEYAFALFLDQINFNEQATDDEIETALCVTIEKLTKIRAKAGIQSDAQMNFAVSNGQSTFVTRFSTNSQRQPASLFYFQGLVYQQENGFVKLQPDTDNSNSSFIIASEPLSKDSEGWNKVEPNHLVRASNNTFKIKPIVNLN